MDTKQYNDKTMETNGKITDELVAKYISGNTTKEEEDLIHDYLARNPVFANDLLDIATALRHQHKYDAAIKKKEQEESKEAKRIQITPRRTFYAVAASIVVLIGIGLLLFKYLAPSSDSEEFVLVNYELCDTVFTFQQYDCNDLMSEEMSTDNIFLSDIPDSLIYDDLAYSDIEEIPPQETEIVTEHKSETLSLADNSALEHQPQQEVHFSLENSDAATMAPLTVYEENEDALKREDLVFITENMPKSCNIEKDLVLKWECNATSVILELSTDNGETWKAPSYDITGRKHFIIKRNQLKGLARNNPNHCFCWRITAEYDEGSIERFGKVTFSDE